MEKELKETLSKSEQDLKQKTTLFVSAQYDLAHTVKILKKAEDDFVYKSSDKIEVQNYERYKANEEQQRFIELDRVEGDLALDSVVTSRKP